MIESSIDNIHILYPDGSSTVFDSSELRSRLARSLAEANLDDLAVADDLALAVEFSLRSALRESGIRHVSASELDQAVAKSLEDAGFALVAEKFLAFTPEAAGTHKLNNNELAHFFSCALLLDESESFLLGEKVKTALLKLGMEKCSRTLALELAKEFRSLAAEELLRKKHLSASGSRKVLLPAVGSLIGKLDEKEQHFFTQGAIHLSGNSTLFPSVRVEISLEKLLEISGMKLTNDFPVTELVLAPLLGACASAVDAIYEEMCKAVPEGKLPLVITFTDMAVFVEKYFLAGKGEGAVEKCSRSLGVFFKGMLKNLPFRIRYGK